MILRMLCRALPLAIIPLTGVLLPSAARADRTMLPDTTWEERWTLASGVRVITRHIPKATTISATVCYPSGSRSDPSGREGLAELAAQVVFTARAEGVPERAPEQLSRLRPSGWSIKVTPQITQLTESAPQEQFPSVLHQICLRIRGVTPNENGLNNAKQAVEHRLRDAYDIHPDRALHFFAAELSSGRSSESTLRYGSGEGLANISLQDVRRLISSRFTPASAVVCIVGDLEGFDLHKLIDADLANVPVGVAASLIPWGRLRSAQGAIDRSDLDHGVGVVGILAPALTDSLHPYFTAVSFATWGALTRLWGKPEPPLTTRFQFSVSGDPELARIYPPTRGGTMDPGDALGQALDEVWQTVVDSIQLQRACDNGLWLLGGPLPPEVRQRAAEDPATVHTLATTLSALEMYGTPTFWEAYRARFLTTPLLDMRPLLDYFNDRRHQVSVLFRVPPR